MIQRKNKQCRSCPEITLIWSHGECKSCAGKTYAKKASAVKKPKHAINKVSEKRKQEQKSYTVLRRLFLEANPECACGGVIEGCDGQAVDIHHMTGKLGEKYLDVRFWKGLTRSCHSWCELHPNLAKEMGLSLNRL